MSWVVLPYAPIRVAEMFFHLKLDQNFAVIRSLVEDMWRELASHKVLAPCCKYARTPEHA